MHTVLVHDGYLPASVTITDAKTHESHTTKALELPKSSIVVFDEGFIDYTWLLELG